MSTVLLVWYALGWVARGMVYWCEPEEALAPGIAVFCFALPLLIILMSLWFLAEDHVKPKTQYLWRKP